MGPQDAWNYPLPPGTDYRRGYADGRRHYDGRRAGSDLATPDDAADPTDPAAVVAYRPRGPYWRGYRQGMLDLVAGRPDAPRVPRAGRPRRLRRHPMRYRFTPKPPESERDRALARRP
jgi:hypothetical protein